MAQKTDLDEPIAFRIPENFISKGTILGGMFKTRNAVEAAIAVLILGFPLYKIPMNVTLKIILMIVICVPVGILALIGLNRGPLSEFIMDVFKHRKLTHDYKYKSSYIKEKEKGEDNNEKQRKA